MNSEVIRSGSLASPQVLALLGGPLIEDYKTTAKRQHDVGMTTDADIQLGYVRPSNVSPYQGSTVALDTCEDGSAVNAVSDGKPVMKLQIVKGHAYFTRVDGAFRLWWTDGEVSPHADPTFKAESRVSRRGGVRIRPVGGGIGRFRRKPQRLTALPEATQGRRPSAADRVTD
jgi:hypothetical protein